MRMNKKTIIALTLCVAVFFMAVGYSILKTELRISGGANISSTWDVRIDGITTASVTGAAYNMEKPSYTDTTATFKVVLVETGDTMTYNVTITNYGTVTAILNDLSISESGTSYITYTVSGIKEGETLAAGETKTLTVVATCNSGAVWGQTRSRTLKVGLDWGQYINDVEVPTGTYKVRFMANGGEGIMEDRNCTVGSTCILPNNTFTRPGYTFAGWYFSPDASPQFAYPDGSDIGGIGTQSSGQTRILYAMWLNNYSYITEGLLVQYDGIDNNGMGIHTSTTSSRWVDLSGKGNHGTISGATWGTNYLSFDGNDYVSISAINKPYITLEAVVSFNSLSSAAQHIVGNFEGGGAGIELISGQLQSNIYVSSSYRPIVAVSSPVVNQKYTLTLTYDGTTINTYINGTRLDPLTVSGTIGAPGSSTIWMIGANPGGTSPQSNYFTGKIYSIRMYDRALTQEEVLNNQNIDMSRFGI